MYPLEHLIETFQIHVYCQTYRRNGETDLGQPNYDYNKFTWVAISNTPRKETSEADTVREAVDKLAEKLTE